MNFEDINMIFRSGLLLATLASVANAAITSCSEKDQETKIVVGVLLPLHQGDDCLQVDLGGMQKLAAVETIVKSINKNGAHSLPFDLELKTFDTCSTEEGTVKAVLRALVAAKQTCPNPPLFAGFIGPDDPDELAAAHQITSVFKLTHLTSTLPPIPRTVLPHQWNNAIYPISQSPAKRRVEVIMKTLERLNWSTVAIITDDSSENIKQTNMLQTQPNLCIKGIYKLDNVGIYNNIIAQITSLDVDGVLIITERVGRFSRMLKYVDTNMGTRIHMRFLIYVDRVGIASWQLPSNTLLVQEVSEVSTASILPTLNSTLYAQFVQQQLNQFLVENCQPDYATKPECSLTVLKHDLMFDLVDSSVTPLTYSLQLMTAALQTAHRIKCKAGGSEKPQHGVCPALLDISMAEWKSYLTQTTTLSKDLDVPRRIKINMDLPVLANIYVKDGNSDRLIQVGEIRDETLTVMEENIFGNLRRRGPSKGSESCGSRLDSGKPILTVPPTKTIQRVKPVDDDRTRGPAQGDNEDDHKDESPTKVEFDWWSLLPRLKGIENDEAYETMVLMAAVGTGMFLFLILCIYVIYSNFRISSGKSDSSENSRSPRRTQGSGRRRSSQHSQQRQRQRSGSIRSVRSNRSVRSEAST